jgi:hypothetical protein
MVLVTNADAPKVALVGALSVTLKASAGSAVVSSIVAVRTNTDVTPAGIVITPVPGTALNVAPPSVE